jgi:predicted RNA binding protein YcfA (HicA-like mRNA interferase family)
MPSREIKPKILLKALLKAGFEVKRRKGSHVFVERIQDKEVRMTSISLHNKPVPRGTLRAILKQVGMSEEELGQMM